MSIESVNESHDILTSSQHSQSHKSITHAIFNQDQADYIRKVCTLIFDDRIKSVNITAAKPPQKNQVLQPSGNNEESLQILQHLTQMADEEVKEEQENFKLARTTRKS